MAYTELQKRQHIRELQGYLHGISHIQHMPATGETDTATWNAVAQAYLQEVRPPVLHLALFPTGITAYTLGDTGGAVFVIQGILQAIQNNFPKIPPISNSGVFDTATQNAVKQFQSYTPLPADGVVDAATWNHLLAALDAEIRNSAGVV